LYKVRLTEGIEKKSLLPVGQFFSATEAVYPL
jgi:hypothetical protein